MVESWPNGHGLINYLEVIHQESFFRRLHSDFMRYYMRFTIESILQRTCQLSFGFAFIYILFYFFNRDLHTGAGRVFISSRLVDEPDAKGGSISPLQTERNNINGQEDEHEERKQQWYRNRK